ncbi:MAG: 5'/3'-nucleotidase SurE [Rickettsiales bacterium]
MNILVSNDDGINATGLESLERIAAKLSKTVWVVAPETEQSGAGHSLSLHLPVRVREVAKKRYAVSGTPTDCVLLALKEIIPAKQKISLVLSGVNRGSNAGDDITYSGTVAAAMEATNLDVPAIALSQTCNDSDPVQWKTAEKFAPDLIKKLVKQGWPKGTFININFPACVPSKVKGVRVCPQGKRIVNVNLTGRMDPKNRPYYWLGGERDNKADRKGVDVDFLYKDYITITPISMDMTDYDALKFIAKAVE